MIDGRRINVVYTRNNVTSHVSLLLANNREASEMDFLRYYLNRHPHIFPYGCIDDIHLLAYHGMRIYNLILKPCYFNSRQVGHEKITLVKQNSSLLEIAVKNANQIASNMAKEGNYNDAVYILNKVVDQIKNGVLLKESAGILKLITAQRNHMLNSALPVSANEAVTANLQRVKVMRFNGDVKNAIRLFVSTLKKARNMKLGNSDLHDVLTLAVEFSLLTVAFPFARTASARSNLELGTLQAAALIVEALGDKTNQNEARRVYHYILRQKCNNNVPAGQCMHITSHLSDYSRYVLFHKGAPSFNEVVTSAGIKTNYTQLMSALGFDNIQVQVRHIETVQFKDPEDFWSKYSDIAKPVLLQGFVSFKTRHKWTLDRLKANMGSFVMSVSQSADIVPRQWTEDCRAMLFDCDDAFSENALFFQSRLKFSDFLKSIEESPVDKSSRLDYIFGPTKKDILLDDLTKEVEKYFPLDRFNLDKRNGVGEENNPLFYMGGPGSGTYFHYHSGAVNVLMHGLKKWFLLPPQTTHGPGAMDMRKWMKRVYKSLPVRPLEVIQRPGEALYIPSGWKHAIINLEPSIGVAFQVGENMILRLPTKLRR